MPQGGAALINAGSRATADLVATLVPFYAYKAADQSVTSSTVMVNDTDLVAPVTANFGYEFECYLDYEAIAGANFGLAWTWVVPSGATLRYQAVYTRSSDGGNVTGTTYKGGDTVTALGQGAGNLAAVTMTGTLFVAGTSGNLQLKWAQGTSSATATIVHGQSFLMLQRMF